ncbi:hypothetical protein AAY473_026401 [Plecturocebus cupreus]
MPVIPATQEAEAGESLEPARQRLHEESKAGQGQLRGAVSRSGLQAQAAGVRIWRPGVSAVTRGRGQSYAPSRSTPTSTRLSLCRAPHTLSQILTTTQPNGKLRPRDCSKFTPQKGQPWGDDKQASGRLSSVSSQAEGWGGGGQRSLSGPLRLVGSWQAGTGASQQGCFSTQTLQPHPFPGSQTLPTSRRPPARRPAPSWSSRKPQSLCRHLPVERAHYGLEKMCQNISLINQALPEPSSRRSASRGRGAHPRWACDGGAGSGCGSRTPAPFCPALSCPATLCTLIPPPPLPPNLLALSRVAHMERGLGSPRNPGHCEIQTAISIFHNDETWSLWSIIFQSFPPLCPRQVCRAAGSAEQQAGPYRLRQLPAKDTPTNCCGKGAASCEGLRSSSLSATGQTRCLCGTLNPSQSPLPAFLGQCNSWPSFLLCTRLSSGGASEALACHSPLLPAGLDPESEEAGGVSCRPRQGGRKESRRRDREGGPLKGRATGLSMTGKCHVGMNKQAAPREEEQLSLHSCVPLLPGSFPASREPPLGALAHACNPSTLGGRSRQIT